MSSTIRLNKFSNQFICSIMYVGRSPESSALFGDPPKPLTLPVEIGLRPVDTRGEHAFAIFGRKEYIYKKRFLISSKIRGVRSF